MRVWSRAFKKCMKSSDFDSGWMKLWIGFILSIMIVLCTDIATPLCQAFLNKITFDNLMGMKALMMSVLLCLLLLSLLLQERLRYSVLLQIQKALKWKAGFQHLEKNPMHVESKLAGMNKVLKNMRSDLDLVAHYPETDFQDATEHDYEVRFVTLLRVIDVYNKTLSDEYYRSKYLSFNKKWVV